MPSPIGTGVGRTYDLGQYERAIENYDEAIRLRSPADVHLEVATAYYNRGLAYEKLGKRVESERDFGWPRNSTMHRRVNCLPLDVWLCGVEPNG